MSSLFQSFRSNLEKYKKTGIQIGHSNLRYLILKLWWCHAPDFFFFSIYFLLIFLCFTLFFFSGSKVLLCDFQREQAWLRWLSSTNNGMREYKEGCLQLLRNIAISEAFEEYTMAVNKLRKREIWSLPKASGFETGSTKHVTTLSSMFFNSMSA